MSRRHKTLTERAASLLMSTQILELPRCLEGGRGEPGEGTLHMSAESSPWSRETWILAGGHGGRAILGGSTLDLRELPGHWREGRCSGAGFGFESAELAGPVAVGIKGEMREDEQGPIFKNDDGTTVQIHELCDVMARHARGARCHIFMQHGPRGGPMDWSWGELRPPSGGEGPRGQIRGSDLMSFLQRQAQLGATVNIWFCFGLGIGESSAAAAWLRDQARKERNRMLRRIQKQRSKERRGAAKQRGEKRMAEHVEAALEAGRQVDMLERLREGAAARTSLASTEAMCEALP